MPLHCNRQRKTCLKTEDGGFMEDFGMEKRKERKVWSEIWGNYFILGWTMRLKVGWSLRGFISCVSWLRSNSVSKASSVYLSLTSISSLFLRAPHTESWTLAEWLPSVLVCVLFLKWTDALTDWLADWPNAGLTKAMKPPADWLSEKIKWVSGWIWGPTGPMPRVRLHYQSGGARPQVGRLSCSGETDKTLGKKSQVWSV